MAVTVTTDRETVTRIKTGVGLEGTKPRNGRGGRGPGGGGGPNDGGGPGGGGPGGRDRSFRPDRYRIGIFVGIASILMMFTALASAYIIRAGLPGSTDWRVLPVPSFIWLSTTLILLSSLTFGVARRALARGEERSCRRWLGCTLALGLAFLGSQLMAWRQLVAQGLYLASNPHSSFFYVLTGLHGLHLTGGILGLSYLLWHASRGHGAERELRTRTYTDVVALYWHFMDGLWVFLFLLLFLWR